MWLADGVLMIVPAAVVKEKLKSRPQKSTPASSPSHVVHKKPTRASRKDGVSVWDCLEFCQMPPLHHTTFLLMHLIPILHV